MRDDLRIRDTGIERSPAPLPKQCQYTFTRSALSANHYPYCYFTPGSIRFWCRDPSVRSSSKFSWVARVGSSAPASGSFAAKSEWTLATIPLQCRNPVLCSRGTPARRASKTSSAFFQDTCVTVAISDVGLAVTRRYTHLEQ